MRVLGGRRYNNGSSAMPGLFLLKKRNGSRLLIGVIHILKLDIQSGQLLVQSVTLI
jgi:hypothetical protein